MSSPVMRRAALLIAAATLSSPYTAAAQDQALPSCRAAMQEQWADLVRADRAGNGATILVPGPGGVLPPQPIATATDPLRQRLTTLAESCFGDREARNDIVLLDAARSRAMDDPARALALLATTDIRPGDRSYNLYFAEWLKAHSQAGTIAAALPAVLDRHEQALLANGARLERNFAVRGIEFRAYRLAAPQEGWLLVGVHPDAEIETIVAGPAPWARDFVYEDGRIPFALTNARCSTSNQPFDEGGIAYDASMTLDPVIAMLEQTYADPDRPNARGDGPGVQDFCPNLADMLPGFGPQVEFSGVEYRDRTAGFTELDLLIALQSEDMATRLEATDYLFDHPDAVEPINLGYGIATLIGRGDMERATFWYFIWQTRTRPWMAANSNLAQLRGALAASLGPTLLEWAGSDYDALVALQRRAIRYERLAPLYSGRPSAVSDEAWTRMIAMAREENGEANMIGILPPKAEFDAQRQSNGLTVGPWQSPGRPLKDEWR